jgi:hypothetical protein
VSLEGIARLFVGIGFLWMAIVLVVGIAGGFDKPAAFVKVLGDALAAEWVRQAYLALALFVVPVGILTFLRDILGDPVALWVKWAAPGAFVAIYAFFLFAALPEVGGPFFQGLESIVSPASGSKPPPLDSTGAWLVRFAVAFAVLAGVPGFIGGIVGTLSGSKTGVRRH